MSRIAIESDVPPLSRQLEIVRTSSNARWSAVIAGVFATLATWLVLHVFGLGVGLTAIDPEDPSSLRSSGVGFGVWSLIAPILALFVGGLVVSRLAPMPNRINRALQGGLVWAVTTVVSVIAIYALTTEVVRGSAKISRQATMEAAEATGQALLGLSISIVLGLVAALCGALAIGSIDRRRERMRRVDTTPPVGPLP